MASWTIPAFGRVVTLVLVAWATLSCGRVDIAPRTTVDPPLRLLVGAQYDVVLRPAGGGKHTIGNPHDDFPGVAANFRSNDAAVRKVDGPLNTVTLVADNVGSATISARLGHSGPIVATLDVHVVDKATAANEMALEICPTTDAAAIRQDKPLSGTIAAEHGMHDCQRLIKDNSYLALTGIFAHDNLLLDRPGDFEHGRLAAVIVNFAGGKAAQSYDTLGIGPGTNCLILRFTSPNTWEAAVVHLQTTGGVRYARCPDAMTWPNAGTAATFLKVIPYPGVDLQNTPVAPPAARWDTDAARRINTIGVKCGASTWCDILPYPATPSEPLKHAAGSDLLKGYYDDQFLANSSATAPSTVFGTIRPGADNAPGQPHDDTSRTYTIADILIEETRSAAPDGYEHYYKGFVDPAATAFPTPARSSLRIKPAASMNPHHMFSAFFGSKPLKSGAVYRRHSHAHAPSPNPIPPLRTARWRWDAADERTWTFCSPDGCCESLGMLT